MFDHLLKRGVKPRYFKSHILKDSELHTKILDATFFLSECTLNERVYCILNNIHSLTVCHYDDCNNSVEFRGMGKGYAKFCSSKCSQLNNVNRQPTEQSIAKRKETMKLRYGVEHNFQKGSELYERKQETIRNRYGVDNVSSSSEVQQHKQKLIRENHNGLHYAQTDEYKNNKCSVLMERYGVSNPSKIDEVNDKRSKTHHNKSQKEKREIVNKRTDTIYRKLDSRLLDRDWLFDQHITQRKSVCVIADELGVYYGTVQHRLSLLDVPFHKHTSTFEHELQEIIRQLGFDIITNDRSVLGGSELDILIPDKNIAIECDGVYWHSDCHDRIYPNYHLDKTVRCQDNGIQLLHIFENEWNDTNKRDIWKSIIQSKLHRSNRIYARNCNVVALDPNTTATFLEHNHIQGKGQSNPISYGLVHGGDVVAVMTFGNSRYNKKFDYELLRFCNKKYTTVVGGAGKLFKHFQKTYPNSSMITYADMRRSNGNLYEQLGFKMSHASNPNYFYWKNPNILMSRLKFQKHKLSQILENFDPNLTEYHNMVANGYKRIWDCGNLVYTYS